MDNDKGAFVAPGLTPRTICAQSFYSKGTDMYYEAMLTQIWQDLFHLEHFEVEETFFALGGDSLVAIRMIARIGQVTGVAISMRNLFDAPTIAALAALLEHGDELPPYTPIRPSTKRYPRDQGVAKISSALLMAFIVAQRSTTRDTKS